MLARSTSSGGLFDREDDKVVEGNDRASSVSSRTDLYWGRLRSMTVGDERLRRTVGRSRCFEQEAER